MPHRSLAVILVALSLPTWARGEEASADSTPPATATTAWSVQRTQTHALAAGALFVAGGLALGAMSRQDTFHANRALGIREARVAQDASRLHATSANVLFALAGAALTWGLVAGIFGAEGEPLGRVTF